MKRKKHDTNLREVEIKLLSELGDQRNNRLLIPLSLASGDAVIMEYARNVPADICDSPAVWFRYFLTERSIKEVTILMIGVWFIWKHRNLVAHGLVSDRVLY